MGILGFVKRSIFLTILLTVVVLMMGTALVVGGALIDGFDPTPDPVKEDEVEDETLERINEIRAERNLPTLVVHEPAKIQATRHSENMAEEGEVSHVINNETAEDRLIAARCTDGAENAAKSIVREDLKVGNDTIYTSSSEDVAEHLVRSWMNSTPHKRIMLSREYRATGLGIHINEDREVYATQIFCSAAV
jgi:uncharacterized protein YkwD